MNLDDLLIAECQQWAGDEVHKISGKLHLFGMYIELGKHIGPYSQKAGQMRTELRRWLREKKLGKRYRFNDELYKRQVSDKLTEFKKRFLVSVDGD